MATLKNTTAAPADVLVRFSVGEAELSVAADAAQADAASAESAVAIYDLIFGDFPKGHGVTLQALRKLGTGERRSNEDAAAWQFVRRFHAIRRCGQEIADKLQDANVKGDALLQKAGVNPMTMAAYKPQAKRQIVQSIYNTDDWGKFLGKMAEIAAARGRAAKIAALVDAGEAAAVIEAAEAAAEAGEKRGTKSTKTEMERVLAKVGEVIKLLRRDAEKRDGSIDLEVSQKLAAYLADGLNAYGIK